MNDLDYMKTKGVGKIYTQTGNERHSMEASWDVDYDGEEMDMNVDIVQDGKKEHIHQKLDNEDLAQLLNLPTKKRSLHDRLSQDFLIDQKVYKIERVPRKSRKKIIKLSRKKKLRGVPLKIKVKKRGSRRKRSKKSSKKSSSRKSTSSRKKSKAARPASPKASSARGKPRLPQLLNIMGGTKVLEGMPRSFATGFINKPAPSTMTIDPSARSK